MKKLIALILVYILLIDLTSCHSYSYISSQQDYETYQNKKHLYVLDLATKKDSIVYFSESFPGKFSNNEVKGPRQILLRNFNADYEIFYKNNTIIKYAVKNGIKYKVKVQDSIALVCITTDTIQIPFSEIKQIHIKKSEAGKTAGLILACGAVIGIALYLIAVNMTFDIEMGGL